MADAEVSVPAHNAAPHHGFEPALNATPDNFFLTGHWTPVQDELRVENLKVRGAIPEEIRGTWYRNGPNPYYTPSLYNWPFDGDGMIHAVRIQDGRASYRNAWIKTKGLLAEIRAGRPLYGSMGHPGEPVDPKLLLPGDDPGPYKNVVHIHFVRHAGHYLAMHGPTMPYELDRDLNTLGVYDFGGACKRGFSGHPKIDPRTGEMFGFWYGGAKPYLIYYVVAPDGRMVVNQGIDTEHPCFLHDFALTENYVVFLLQPALLNPDASMTWHAELPMAVYVLPRSGDVSKARIFQTDPFFVFHFVNAYEDGVSRIVIDYTRWRAYGTGIPGSPDGDRQTVTLNRLVVDTDRGVCTETEFDSRFNEFPRINDAVAGREHRYAYIPTRTRPGQGWMLNALFRYDFERNTHVVQDYGSEWECGEPMFAARPGGAAEDDGWIMQLVSNWAEKRSELRIFDAADIGGEPVAVIEMPRRVPHGIHGNWYDDVP